jgi:hypothetical protein
MPIPNSFSSRWIKLALTLAFCYEQGKIPMQGQITAVAADGHRIRILVR